MIATIKLWLRRRQEWREARVRTRWWWMKEEDRRVYWWCSEDEQPNRRA